MNELNVVMSPEEMAMDTLTAFVRDAEHDSLAVVTALQAHIDLLHDEQVRNHLPVDRFAVVNRAVARLLANTAVLASISELARAPQSKHKLLLEVLMQEIAAETRSAFSYSQVSLSCQIAPSATLTGNAAPLKSMITEMVLAVLQKCTSSETVRIVGLTDRNSVSLSFDIGMAAKKGAYSPWRLGGLRLMPINGEGISLSAVDAMARLHNGQLSVSNLPNRRHGYKLTFDV